MTDTTNCVGCHDDYYNRNDCGLNMTPDGPRCSRLATAVFTMNVEAHIDQRPPYMGTPRRRLACYRRPRHIYLKGEDVA